MNYQNLSPYDRGFIAASIGLDTAACPYMPDSNRGREWFRGYRDARRKQKIIRRKMPRVVFWLELAAISTGALIASCVGIVCALYIAGSMAGIIQF